MTFKKKEEEKNVKKKKNFVIIKNLMANFLSKPKYLK